MHLSGCFCALALANAVFASPLVINQGLSKNLPSHTGATADSAARHIPDFDQLSEEAKEMWYLFFDCHPLNPDGTFIDFTSEGICESEEEAFVKRDTQFEFVPLHKWKESSWKHWLWPARTKHESGHSDTANPTDSTLPEVTSTEVSSTILEPSTNYVTVTKNDSLH